MVGVFTFLTVFFLLLALYEGLSAGRRTLEKRLQQVASSENPVTVTATAPRREAFAWLRSVLTRFRPARGPMERLEEELCRADIPLRVEEFLVLAFCTTFFVGTAGYLVTHQVFGGILGAACGFVLPISGLRVAQARRLRAFNAQIADALVVMANTLRAGFGFLQAMEVVRREMPPPISKEFGRALTEMSFGIGAEEALLNLVKRVKSEDLDLVVTAVVIQRTVGGNLATILDTISETIRERVRIKGEIKTLTAQGRISGMIIGLLPVGLALLLYFINPAYLTALFETAAGRTMVVVAVAAEIVGLLIIRRIVDIKI
ncbi:MAG: type II secretion system F family protein [Bacillota bacterium]